MSGADSDLYNEFRRWRLTVRADWEAFMEYRDLKAKAEAFERTTEQPPSDRTLEGSIGQGQTEVGGTE